MITFIIICNYFFFFYLIIYATILLITNIYGSITMYNYRRKEMLHNQLEEDFYLPISIIVPAFNENECLIQTVKNLLKLDYRRFEIVVVDDGSTDNTKSLMIDTFKMQRFYGMPIRYQVPCKQIREYYSSRVNGIQIIMISKVNGGCKADASNAGINVASYPYFVDMDADEVLQRDALRYVARAFAENSEVIGVGGNIKISNNVKFKDATPVEANLSSNPIANMQVLEYGRAFIGSRIFYNNTNSNMIISGGFGAFKKSVVIKVGGYDVYNKGEDMELTMKLHKYYRMNKIPYKMVYVPDAVCWTQAPDSMKDFKKQRQRWYVGLIQNYYKYRSMMFNPKYGYLGMATMPFNFFYELLCPEFIILGWFLIVASLILKIINLRLFIIALSSYILFGIMLTLTMYIDKSFMKNDYYSYLDVIRAIFIAFLDAAFFRPHLFLMEFAVLFKYSKVAKGWHSPKRIQIRTD